MPDPITLHVAAVNPTRRMEPHRSEVDSGYRDQPLPHAE